MVQPVRNAGDALTPKEDMFVRLVVSGEPYIDAYMGAYDVKPDASRKSVKVAANRVAQRVPVRAKLAELRAAITDEMIVERIAVLQEIMRIALADPRGIVNDKGQMRMVDELDTRTAASVASFEISDTGGIKYKFHDKNAALEKAAKILGLYQKDNRQKTDPLAELLSQLNGNVMGITKNPPPEDEDA